MLNIQGYEMRPKCETDSKCEQDSSIEDKIRDALHLNTSMKQYLAKYKDDEHKVFRFEAVRVER